MARGLNLAFSTEVEDCVKRADMVFLCVETPTWKTGVGRDTATDVDSLKNAVEKISRWGKDRLTVVKDTVLVGTAVMIRQQVRDLLACHQIDDILTAHTNARDTDEQSQARDGFSRLSQIPNFSPQEPL